MSEKFLYEIRPVRKVVLPGRLPIRHSCSIDLNKEEVMICMNSGPVYRKFSDMLEPVRVTGANLDSLHVDSLKKSTVVEENKDDNSIDTGIITDDEKNLEEEECIVHGENGQTSVEVDKCILPEVNETNSSEEREFSFDNKLVDNDSDSIEEVEDKSEDLNSEIEETEDIPEDAKEDTNKNVSDESGKESANNNYDKDKNNHNNHYNKNRNFQMNNRGYKK